MDPGDLRSFLTAYSTSLSRKDFAVDVSQLNTLALIFDSIANRLWDYLNFDLAGSLIDHFTHQDQICVELFADYQRDFTGYLLTTEIVHHIAAKRGAGPTATPPENIPSEELCSKLTVKLAIDITTHSLKYVEEVWKTLLRRSQLPKHTLLLRDIAESSLMITWLFPKNKAAELADAILENTHELRLKRVYLITINKSVIFQADLSKMAVDFKVRVTIIDTQLIRPSILQIGATDIARLLVAVSKGKLEDTSNSDIKVSLISGDHVTERSLSLQAGVGARLVAAVKQGNLGLVASLLELGADVNSSKDERGFTPLVAGCASGSTELVKLLIERGADVNIRNVITTNVITPLGMALHKCHEEVAVLLIEHGADVNAVGLETNEGEVTASLPPLMQAAGNGLQHATKLFLERGAEVDKETKMSSGGESLSLTALMYTATAEVATLLLDHGAQIDFQGSHRGLTALMRASAHGHYEVAELLLERGAQVDLRDSEGGTALMFAVEKYENIPDKDAVGLARLLLQHGANPQLKDKKGKTALAYALYRGDKELIELLSDPAKASAPRDTSQHTPRPTTEHKKDPRSIFGSFKGLFSEVFIN